VKAENEEYRVEEDGERLQQDVFGHTVVYCWNFDRVLKLVKLDWCGRPQYFIFEIIAFVQRYDNCHFIINYIKPLIQYIKLNQH